MVGVLATHCICNKEFNIIRKDQTGFVECEICLNTVSAVIEIVEIRTL